MTLFYLSVIIFFAYFVYQWFRQKFFFVRPILKNNSRILVTGCDSGFGHLLVKKLVQEGHTTFAGCYTENGEKELQKAVGSSPGVLYTFPLNVVSQKSVDEALEFVKSKLQPNEGLSGLVNNAGILGVFAPDDLLTEDDFQATLDVNFLGSVRMTHAFKPLLKLQSGGARLIFMSSIDGRLAQSHRASYAASKFAVEAYADVLRRELKPQNVTVHIMNPGGFRTEATSFDAAKKRFETFWGRLTPETQEKMGGEVFFKNRMASIPVLQAKYLNQSVDLVIDAYYHALTSCYPKSHYYIGDDSKYIYAPISCMPTWLGDLALEFVDKYQIGWKLVDRCNRNKKT